MKNNPKISVITCFYNAEKTLKEFLKGISNQTFRDFELILVDNGSTDNSIKMIKDFVEKSDLDVKLVYESLRGPSFARNKGLDYAKGEIIAFTDADCVPHPDWLKEILNALQNVDAVAGKIRGFRAQNLIQKFLNLFFLTTPDKDKLFYKPKKFEGGFPTSNFSVKKSVFERIGKFDVSFAKNFGDDFDFVFRFYKAGYKLRYTTKALVYHIHRDNFFSMWKQAFRIGLSHALLLKKHGGTVIELPKYRVVKERGKIMLDFVGADKKFLLSIIFGLFLPFGYLIPLFYLIYLYFFVRRKAKKLGESVNFFENLLMIFLLIIRSFGITCGRICGSYKYKVLCL